MKTAPVRLKEYDRARRSFLRIDSTIGENIRTFRPYDKMTGFFAGIRAN